MSEHGNELDNNTSNKKPNRLAVRGLRHTKTEANLSAQSYVEPSHYKTPDAEIPKPSILKSKTMLPPV